MVILHAKSDFIDGNCVSNSSPSYWYEGRCPQTGEMLQLPRTCLAEAIASGLMKYLNDERYSLEGKMYGILLVELPDGEQRILKAFSGLLNGCSVVEGWVPSIPGRDEVALLEARTLAQLDAIKNELIILGQIPERQQHETLSKELDLRWQQISLRHRFCQQKRQEKRHIFSQTLAGEALTNALFDLDAESRTDGIERRQFKRYRMGILQPLKQAVAAADARMRELKQQRKELSRQLQAQMHAAYSLMNFLGNSKTLSSLIPQGLPTGTGDCCAPKLLHYAATHNLKPLAMAEFWWGSSSDEGDKIQGEFYGACAARCKPLMGFLLSGLSQNYIGSKSPGRQEINFNSSEAEPPNPRSQAQPGNEISRHLVVDTGARCELKRTNEHKFYLKFFWHLNEEKFPIVYEDEWLIVINKPAGLLSVPGRYLNSQDSVISRLRHLLSDGESLRAVHRLDGETSGILVLARDLQTYRQLSQQFEKRQIKKIYEAIVCGTVTTDGIIDLPLWGEPENRPYQQVNWQKGKPSVTHFRVMANQENYTRVEFIPLTGRTHQLRVHAADLRGLGVPILGDKLYGRDVASRLYLHARELCLWHPQLGEMLELEAKTPF